MSSRLTVWCCGLLAAGCMAEVSEDETATASAYDFQAIEPCASEQDYVARGVVQFGYGLRTYTPACARIVTGGTVVFQGPLDEHPLEPMPGEGADRSPIVAARSGGRVEYELPDYGFFPYRCARHPDETGVIWASSAF